MFGSILTKKKKNQNVPPAQNGHGSFLPHWFGSDIAIDLGTTNIIVYVKKRGIVVNEPAVIALDTNSRQVIAVGAQSGIETISELEGKTIAVQATGKPEAIFLRGGDNVPAFRDIISLADRGVQYAMLDCGYVDAVAAHEEAIRQYMKDYGAQFRILDEPLLVTGIGVAFSRHDTRGLAARLDEVFEQMREDGSMEKLAGKYLDDPAHSLEVDALEQ